MSHHHRLAKESFVVCVQKCDVEVVETVLMDPSTSASSSRNSGNLITLHAGQLAKVKEVHPTKSVVIIRIYDFYDRNLAFENNLFACPASHLQVVAPPLWPFLIGINTSGARLKFFRSHELVAYLLNLNVGDVVLANVPSANFPLTCIIRYIGLVSEIGPGFYFGLEITVI